uniref:Sodium:solute symporter n=1 Tax=Macrostomum lignano TaxID=282301 RepID=A0A1I8FCM5_9PLAT
FALDNTLSRPFDDRAKEIKDVISRLLFWPAAACPGWSDRAWSLYMSNIGSNNLHRDCGLRGRPTVFGVLCYEFVASTASCCWRTCFVPVYLTSGAFYHGRSTLRRRFGGKRMQILLAVQSLAHVRLRQALLEVYAGSLIIQNTMGWDQVLSITVLLLMTAILHYGGRPDHGHKSRTRVQGVIVVLGAGVLAVMSIDSIGGLSATCRAASWPRTPPTTTTRPAAAPPTRRPSTCCATWPTPTTPGWEPSFGANILSAWHWCTDQLFVQRTLAARSLQHAKAGSVAAGFLEDAAAAADDHPRHAGFTTPRHRRLRQRSACERLCGIPEGCSNVAYIEIIKQMLPTFAGVMIAAMLAALISSITSIFNSGGTLFTIDLWLRLRRPPGEGSRKSSW